jgi:hypothetical protein
MIAISSVKTPYLWHEFGVVPLSLKQPDPKTHFLRKLYHAKTQDLLIHPNPKQ